MRPFSWREVWVPRWPPFEVIFRALVVYLFVLLLFRLLGRKEWTRYADFNVVVLFLIAVALRTTMLGDDYSLTSGLICITALLLTDWLFSLLSYRSDRVADLIQGPVLTLIENGQIRRSVLRKARISESQLLEQIRLKGRTSLGEVETALLERSGHVSFQFKPERSRSLEDQRAS